MSISLLRRLLMKEAVKDTAGSSGIMSINKNIAAKVEQQVQRYVNDAMRQGVDLDTLSPEQLKMIVQMNKPKPPRVIAGDSPEGRGITEALLGKRGEIIDFPQKRSFKQEVDDMIKDGTITKGARGMKKSKKVQDREMFQDANKRLKTEAQLKAEMEASNKKAVKNLGNKRQLTEDEYQDFLDEVGGADQLEAYDFDGTVGSANKIKKQQADYMAEMQMEYRKGKLDPEPGSRTPQRKRFLQSKLDEAEASGDARLLSREEREELFDLDDIEDFAGGGRAGFKGGGLTPEDYLKVKDMLNHWHDYKKGGGTLSKTKFANAFFRENNADGGRTGYFLGSMVGKARQQKDGIETRLEQLGGDVTSAEQMLQQINQRLESAGSSVPESGGASIANYTPQLPAGGLGSLPGLLDPGSNANFSFGKPETFMSRPLLGKPLNAQLPATLETADPNNLLPGTTVPTGGTFNGMPLGPGKIDNNRFRDPVTGGGQPFYGGLGADNQLNVTEPQTLQSASSQQNLQKALPGLFADGGVAGLLGERTRFAGGGMDASKSDFGKSKSTNRERGIMSRGKGPKGTTGNINNTRGGGGGNNNTGGGGGGGPPSTNTGGGGGGTNTTPTTTQPSFRERIRQKQILDYINSLEEEDLALGIDPRKKVLSGIFNKGIKPFFKKGEVGIEYETPDLGKILKERVVRPETDFFKFKGGVDLGDTLENVYKSGDIKLKPQIGIEGSKGGVNYGITYDKDGNTKFNLFKKFADGGPARQNFKMGKRAFLKAMFSAGAGIAGLKSGLFGMGGKEATKKAVTETVKSAGSGTPPPYFFKLVEKIKTMGDDTLATQDKAIAKKYKDYTMEEDFAGNIEIIKKGDDVAEDVYMSYKVDEVPVKGKKGSAKVEEYEEFTARPDAEGKMKDIEPGVPDEVVNEGSVFEDNMTEFGMTKKASGGIARMLGE